MQSWITFDSIENFSKNNDKNPNYDLRWNELFQQINFPN